MNRHPPTTSTATHRSTRKRCQPRMIPSHQTISDHLTYHLLVPPLPRRHILLDIDAFMYYSCQMSCLDWSNQVTEINCQIIVRISFVLYSGFFCTKEPAKYVWWKLYNVRSVRQLNRNLRFFAHTAVLFCSWPFSIPVLATPWTYFLHLSLSYVILIDSSTGSPVHVLILSIQAVSGLPHLHAPGILSCIISFSTQLPCFLMVWP